MNRRCLEKIWNYNRLTAFTSLLSKHELENLKIRKAVQWISSKIAVKINQHRQMEISDKDKLIRD